MYYGKCNYGKSIYGKILWQMKLSPGVVESLPMEYQEKGRKVLLPENAYDLSGCVQAVYVENHAEECVELCVGQKLGTIHSM